MKSNKVRCATAALVLALNVMACGKYSDVVEVPELINELDVEDNTKDIIDTIPIEDMDKEIISSLNDLYRNKFKVSEEVINYESTKEFNDVISNYLGNIMYCKGFENNNDVLSVELYNDSNKSITVTRYNNSDFFYAECGQDNWFMNFYASGEGHLNRQYYANDDNNDFISMNSVYNSNLIENINLVSDENQITISLYGDRDLKYLTIGNSYENVLQINVDEDSYNKLDKLITKYSDGHNLRDFLLESEFSQYLEIVLMQDPELYYELIGFDDTKSLKIKTL